MSQQDQSHDTEVETTPIRNLHNAPPPILPPTLNPPLITSPVATRTRQAKCKRAKTSCLTRNRHSPSPKKRRAPTLAPQPATTATINPPTLSTTGESNKNLSPPNRELVDGIDTQGVIQILQEFSSPTTRVTPELARPTGNASHQHQTDSFPPLRLPQETPISFNSPSPLPMTGMDQIFRNMEGNRAFSDIRAPFFAPGSNTWIFSNVAFAKFVSFPDSDLRAHPFLDARLAVLKTHLNTPFRSAVRYADHFLSTRQPFSVSPDVAELLTPTLLELASMFVIINDPTHRWSLGEVYSMLACKHESIASWSVSELRRHVAQLGTPSQVSTILREEAHEDYHGVVLPSKTIERRPSLPNSVYTKQGERIPSTPQKTCPNCKKSSSHSASQCTEPCTWCPRSPIDSIKNSAPHPRCNCPNWKPTKK